MIYVLGSEQKYNFKILGHPCHSSFPLLSKNTHQMTNRHCGFAFEAWPIMSAFCSKKVVILAGKYLHLAVIIIWETICPAFSPKSRMTLFRLRTPVLSAIGFGFEYSIIHWHDIVDTKRTLIGISVFSCHTRVADWPRKVELRLFNGISGDYQWIF